MNKYEEESINTQTEGEPEETQTEEESDNTQEEALTKEQKSKLDSFDRIYAENKELKAKLKVPEKEEPKQELKPEPNELDKVIEQKLNERDLASMDLSDELKAEVKAYAKAKDISYRETLKTPYFNFIKEQEDKKNESEEASISSTSKVRKTNRDFSKLGESEVKDLSDEEFDQYKSWLKSQ